MSPLNDYQHIAENMYNHPLITDNFNTGMEDHYSLALDSLRRREHTLAQKSLETSLNTLTACVRFHVIDPMHNLFLGTSKYVFKL